MATDKKVLAKGLKYMGGALPLILIGPVVIHSSFKNQGHPFYIPVLGLGIIFCILAILLVFLGIRTIMKSLFNS
jgi:Family of unknown function (DUF6095)